MMARAFGSYKSGKQLEGFHKRICTKNNSTNGYAVIKGISQKGYKCLESVTVILFSACKKL